MARAKQVAITFSVQGDEFPERLYFNRFRVDSDGKHRILTVTHLSEFGPGPAYAFAINDIDIRNSQTRALNYLSQLGDEIEGVKPLGTRLQVSSAVTPINYINFSRVDDCAEIAFYHFAVSTLVDRLKGGSKGKDAVVPCYPAIALQCELAVQVGCLKDLFCL